MNYKKNKKVLMVGIDAAGKTSILYKLAKQNVIITIPTIGVVFKQGTYKNLNITIWDSGYYEMQKSCFNFIKY